MGKFVAVSVHHEYVDDRQYELKQALAQHYIFLSTDALSLQQPTCTVPWDTMSGVHWKVFGLSDDLQQAVLRNMDADNASNQVTRVFMDYLLPGLQWHVHCQWAQQR